jgi:hypothetical protein
MDSDKRLLFLKNQFSKIDDDIFDKIVLADPTPAKKYSTWLLRLYSKSKLDLNELPVLTEIINIHASQKEDVPIEFRDINKFDSVVSFLFLMNKWFVKRFLENEKNTKYLENGGKLLFESDDFDIFRILSLEGSINFGSNTSWCTLRAEHFYDYTKSGNLYIVIPKSRECKHHFGKKTQLHFERSEFRNHDNQEVDLIDIILDLPELYEPIKQIENGKGKNEIRQFFDIDNHAISLINIYGISILKFVKTFSNKLLKEMFVTYGEDAYGHIPESTEKTISFVTVLSTGLKSLLKKSHVEISEEIFKNAVMAFPENILGNYISIYTRQIFISLIISTLTAIYLIL